MTDTIKVPKYIKHVHIEQGPTMAVCKFEGFTTLKVYNIHREPKPVLFLKSRRLPS